MGGSTLDSSLTGYSIATAGTYYPLIAAYYMTSTQVKWAHTDSSKANYEVTKV
jgi:hypothetical protein